MKINFGKLAAASYDNWLYSFIVNVMTTHTPNARDWDQTFHITNNEVEVKLTINEVEVPFDSFLLLLEKAHGKMIEKEAKDLIEKSFGRLTQSLDALKENALSKLSDDVLPSWRKKDINK